MKSSSQGAQLGTAEFAHEFVYRCSNAALNTEKYGEAVGLCAEDECDDCKGPEIAKELIAYIDAALAASKTEEK